MKILKSILFLIIGIIVLALVIALFTKKDYAVEREIVINKPKPEVFEYVKHIKNQDNYSVWNKADPGMKKEYSGTDGTVGFIAKWESESDSVGKGEQEIINIAEGNRIDMKLRFKEPMETEDNAYMTTEGIDSAQTKVKWGFKGRMKYPMNLMLLMMDMDQMLGKDLQAGLVELKGILER
jgi:hypothetical protein